MINILLIPVGIYLEFILLILAAILQDYVQEQLNSESFA